MSDFFNSDLGPEGMFDGLDDPSPPAFGGELLSGVMQRGQHIRRQRRLAYGIGSACAALLVAGGAVGIASVGGNNNPSQPALHVPTTPPHPKNPHHRRHSPGATVSGPHGSGNGTTHTTPPACVTPTPSSTESPSATPAPTPTDSVTMSPVTTASPAAYSETIPSPAPTDTSCASPGATATPTPTDSASPTVSPVPPLL